MRASRLQAWIVSGCAACLWTAAVRASAQDAPPSSEPDLVETIIPDEGSTSAAGDVTESIEAASASSPPPQASAGSAGSELRERTKVSGWARESLEFYPYDRGLRRDDPTDVQGVPRDRLLSRTQLLVRASYQHGSWFEATVSGALGVGAFVEGSGRDQGLRGWSSQGTSTLLDARLMEVYLGFFARSFDLRIGQQRVAWGVADVLSPNDVLNARDLRDPFLAEPEMNRVPTPMLRANWYMGPLVLELIGAPLFVPDRSSLYGRNWSALQPDAPSGYRGLFALLTRAAGPSVQEELNGALNQTRLPNHNGEGLWAAGRLGLHTSGLDANLYYQYGYDGTPYLWLNPTFAEVLQGTDFTKAGFSDLAPVLRALDRGVTPLVAEYVRRHHVGFDAVLPLGPFMLKLDAAYQTRRVFYRSDLTSIAAPAALGVVSLDYQTGSLDNVFIVEGVYIRILDDVQGRLLVYARDSYGAAGVLRWPLFSVFSLDLRVLVGISPRFYSLQPALVTKLGSFALKAGALLLDGDPYSLGGYYRHNTTAFLQLRYGF